MCLFSVVTEQINTLNMLLQAINLTSYKYQITQQCLSLGFVNIWAYSISILPQKFLNLPFCGSATPFFLLFALPKRLSQSLQKFKSDGDHSPLEIWGRSLLLADQAPTIYHGLPVIILLFKIVLIFVCPGSSLTIMNCPSSVLLKSLCVSIDTVMVMWRDNSLFSLSQMVVLDCSLGLARTSTAKPKTN